MSQLLLYSGIVVPALLYCSLITHVFYHLHRHQPQPPPDLVWAKSIEVGRRVELIESRSGPLMAYKLLLTCQGSQSLLVHLSEDVVLEDPLVRLEGREEVWQLLSGLCGVGMVEEAMLDIISVQQNEEVMRVELELMISARYLPSFTLPITSHLYLEQEGDQQRIYKIKEEWFGVPGINERTTHRALGAIHSWLRRTHAVIFTVLSTALS